MKPVSEDSQSDSPGTRPGRAQSAPHASQSQNDSEAAFGGVFRAGKAKRAFADLDQVPAFYEEEAFSVGDGTLWTGDELEIGRQFDRLATPIVEASVRPVEESHVRRYVRRTHEPELEDFFYSRHSRIRFALHGVAFRIRSFLSITATWTALAMVVLSVGATVFCYYFDLAADLPLSLLSVGIVFPISFGIGHTFSRREYTLREVAYLKAYSLSLYTGARDWPAQSPEMKVATHQIRDAIGTLLICVRQTMLHNTPSGGSVEVYKAFDDLELHILKLGQLDPNFSASGMFSRLEQCHQKMLEG